MGPGRSSDNQSTQALKFDERSIGDLEGQRRIQVALNITGRK